MYYVSVLALDVVKSECERESEIISVRERGKLNLYILTSQTHKNLTAWMI